MGFQIDQRDGEAEENDTQYNGDFLHESFKTAGFGLPE